MSIISYKLDLVISLVDTTNGRAVPERDINFFRNGEPIRPEKRGEGTFILLDTGREDFDLLTKVRGYYPVTTKIRYELMNENEPLAIVYLIPDGRSLVNLNTVEITGRIPKLSEIEAIGLTKPRCCISDYNARRQEMSVFQMEGSRYLEDVHYGILHAQEETFEHIEIEKNIDAKKMKLRYPLKEPFSVNAPICRIVFGNVEEGGTYRIAMRRQAPETPVILRYLKDGCWYYIKGDFNEMTHEMLQKAKKFENPVDREEVEKT
ncbi:MAG: hypothetical protein K6F37_00250 [Lachnospiraceae bacterium]|nr:hypothetical protein [Lachnospiraceae bacterium]